MGDIHAQIAGNDVGGVRLLEMMDEFGLDSLLPLADEIIDRSERAMRAAIAEVPDGVYTNDGWSDGYDSPVRMAVTITKHGDEMIVDWTGSSPENARGINVVLNYTHAYVTYALKCALCPEVPNNEGSFRPVKVTAPPGCLLNAQPPAPVAGRHIVGHFLPGIVFGALQDILPDRIIAEGAANIWNNQISGRMPDGKSWALAYFLCGGMGARPNSDGLHTTAFPSGVMGVQVEIVESLVPLIVHRREITPDSGGPGRFRGGCGQTLDITCRTGLPYTLGPLFDRTRVAAKGYEGGEEGGLGAIILKDGTHLKDKALRVLAPDERMTMHLAGGGGFYHPFTRDPARVLDDVLDEFVSLGAARERYGVIIDPTTMTIDDAATIALRAGRS